NPVAEAERLGVLAVSGAKVAGEADDHVVETRLSQSLEERLRVALAVKVSRVSDPEPTALVVLEAGEVVEVAAVGDGDHLPLRPEAAHLLGDRVGRRDDRVRLRSDEPRDTADGRLFQPGELRLVTAPVRTGGERIAEVGDPRGARRALDRGTDEVERRNRRGRENDVDILAANA